MAWHEEGWGNMRQLKLHSWVADGRTPQPQHQQSTKTGAAVGRGAWQTSPVWRRSFSWQMTALQLY